MKGFIRWAKREAVSVIPPVLYFAVAFNLIHFVVDLSLKEENIAYFSYATMTIGALIMGKVFAIVDSFPFINLFPDRPLIYNIFWKFCLYEIFIFLVSLFDIFIRLYIHGNNWDFIHLKMHGELHSPIFWSVQIWIMLLLFNFVVYSEFVRVLGKAKVIKILFG